MTKTIRLFKIRKIFQNNLRGFIKKFNIHFFTSLKNTYINFIIIHLLFINWIKSQILFFSNLNHLHDNIYMPKGFFSSNILLLFLSIYFLSILFYQMVYLLLDLLLLHLIYSINKVRRYFFHKSFLMVW